MHANGRRTCNASDMKTFNTREETMIADQEQCAKDSGTLFFKSIVHQSPLGRISAKTCDSKACQKVYKHLKTVKNPDCNIKDKKFGIGKNTLRENFKEEHGNYLKQMSLCSDATIASLGLSTIIAVITVMFC